MRLPIEVETTEERLAFELFEATTLAVGVSMTLPGDAVLIFRGVTRSEETGSPGLVRLEIRAGKGVSISRAAAWLCERVKGRASVIRIGGAAVDVDPVKVEQALNHHAGRSA